MDELVEHVQHEAGAGKKPAVPVRAVTVGQVGDPPCQCRERCRFGSGSHAVGVKGRVAPVADRPAPGHGLPKVLFVAQAVQPAPCPLPGEIGQAHEVVLHSSTMLRRAAEGNRTASQWRRRGRRAPSRNAGVLTCGSDGSGSHRLGLSTWRGDRRVPHSAEGLVGRAERWLGEIALRNFQFLGAGALAEVPPTYGSTTDPKQKVSPRRSERLTGSPTLTTRPPKSGTRSHFGILQPSSSAGTRSSRRLPT